MHQIYDLSFKLITDQDIEYLFSYCGIDAKPMKKVSNERVNSNYTKSILDYPIELESGAILDLEFQSTYLTEDDIRRFYKYSTQLHYDEKKPIFIVVISTVALENYIINYSSNDIDRFTIFVISLKAKDQNKTLNIIKRKIENNEEFSGEDIVAFKLLPLLDVNHKVEVLKEALTLVFKAKTIPEEDLINIINIFLNYAEEWFDKEEFNKLGDDIMGMETLTQRAYDRLTTYFYDKGANDKGIEIARNLLDLGLDIEDIHKVTHLSFEEISNL